MAIEGVVVVRFDEDGELSYHVFGDERVRLFIVDERAPDDRVYEYLSREPSERFRELIPADSEIGSSQDERHPALAGRIIAAMEGRPHLRLMHPEGDEM